MSPLLYSVFGSLRIFQLQYFWIKIDMEFSYYFFSIFVVLLLSADKWYIWSCSKKVFLMYQKFIWVNSLWTHLKKNGVISHKITVIEPKLGSLSLIVFYLIYLQKITSHLFKKDNLACQNITATTVLIPMLLI